MPNSYYVLEQSRLVIMQQNPRTDSLNNKWNLYKQKLSNLHSYETYPKLYGFKFDDALGSSNYPQPTFSVKCDILKSFL
jgi:fructosamine-3-kinase